MLMLGHGSLFRPVSFSFCPYHMHASRYHLMARAGAEVSHLIFRCRSGPMDPERSPNGSRTTPNGLRTDSERTPNDPEQTPNGPRTDSERIPNRARMGPDRNTNRSRRPGEGIPNRCRTEPKRTSNRRRRDPEQATEHITEKP